MEKFLISIRGKSVLDAEKKLKEMGYNVLIENQVAHTLDNSIPLVVDARETGEKTITIIAGMFKFLTK